MPAVRARTRRKPTPVNRQQAVLESLTAAGVRVGTGMLPTIDLPWHGLAAKAYYDAVLAAGHTEVTSGSWPCETEFVDTGDVLYASPGERVYRLEDGSIVHLHAGDTWLTVAVASPSRAHAAHVLAAFQAQYPPLYLSREGEDGVVVPITFWMMGRFGPERRLRRIASAEWSAIERNYSANVRDEVGRLVSDDFKPGEQGQLLLWYGPPGTGKTWGIRALASAWAPWAEFHYITDPDAFFVQDASYMVDVLLHESYEAIDEPTGDLVTAEAGDKWRVLILEDTGELLSADAKDRSGQGLSRLLNVVDGMIGQGLRILVLVTTNDEIESLHPAVQRPGRCASQLTFGPLSADEASEWIGEPVDAPMTLAELYARAGDTGATPAFGPDDDEPLDDDVPARDVDFTPEPDDARDLMASGLDPLTQAAVDAASAPLPELELDDVTPAVAAAVVEHQAAVDPDFAAALETLALNHRVTTEAVVALIGRQAATTDTDRDALVASALRLAETYANRPHPPAPDVHVHMPEQPLSVHVDGPHVEPHVHLPEQPAPVVNFQPGETKIDVHVPAAEVAPINVDVHVPEQPAAPAPVVNVTVPPPPPRTVRVVEDPETGARSFVAEDAAPVADGD